MAADFCLWAFISFKLRETTIFKISMVDSCLFALRLEVVFHERQLNSRFHCVAAAFDLERLASLKIYMELTLIMV